MTTDGIHSQSFAAYKAAAGVSKSMLDKLAHPKTPAHLRAYLDGVEIPTEAQIFGHLVHRVLLEPDTIKGAFAIKPEGMNFATKKGRAWKEDHGGLPIVSFKDAVAVDAMVANLWKHPQAKRLLKDAQFERSLFATDTHGTLRKCRLDALTAGNAIPDLKSCASAAADDFERSIVDYRLFVQAAYYIDLCKLLGMDKQRFCFICVEKSPPYAVAIYSLDDLVVEWGRKTYKRDIQVYRNCIESGEWPAYPPEITNIGVPRWAQKEMDNAA